MKLFGVRPEARDEDYPQPHEAASPPFVDRWGILGYYVPADLMHPDDVKRYLDAALKGESLYCCIREEMPFVVVRNNAGHEYRVHPERFIWIETPRYQLGDHVATKVGTARLGWIARRDWHYKERRLCYLIDIPGAAGRKKHSRRYWDDELELQSPAGDAEPKPISG